LPALVGRSVAGEEPMRGCVKSPLLAGFSIRSRTSGSKIYEYPETAQAVVRFVRDGRPRMSQLRQPGSPTFSHARAPVIQAVPFHAVPMSKLQYDLSSLAATILEERTGQRVHPPARNANW